MENTNHDQQAVSQNPIKRWLKRIRKAVWFIIRIFAWLDRLDQLFGGEDN